MSLLEVNRLSVRFPVRRTRGLLRRSRALVHAVEDVSFTLAEGETLGLVGESGCGKSTLGRAMVRLLRPSEGSIHFQGEDLNALEGAALRERRRGFQMIFQDPYGSLNPRMTIENIVGEALDIHRLAGAGASRRARVLRYLQDVGLDSSALDRYPHQFSGGQRQRIGIARALAVEPRLIVCDEPVSALDVSVQAQVINLLDDLQEQRGIAYLFIAHDLAVVEHISDRILVMYLGRIVESGPAQAVCGTPRHPYTQALISAVPRIDAQARHTRVLVSGDMPSPVDPPAGCPFHPRCPLSMDRCRVERPLLRVAAPEHRVACHLDL